MYPPPYAASPYTSYSIVALISLRSAELKSLPPPLIINERLEDTTLIKPYYY